MAHSNCWKAVYLCLLCTAILYVSWEKYSPLKLKVYGSHVTEEQEIIKLIDACPAWADIKPQDQVKKQLLCACLKYIATKPLSAIRQAEELYVNSKEARNNFDFAEMSKLYVLNRYLFRPSAAVPRDQVRIFGGFGGVPHDDKSVNELWPWSMDAKGQLQITDQTHGYMGESYSAVEEFDYFECMYGSNNRI